MRECVLLDTSPFVAIINRRDQFHGWITAQWDNIEPPLLTCEAVIYEACFLLRNILMLFKVISNSLILVHKFGYNDECC
ncbi:PIN domain-containing protein [Sphaerospermopsis sp. LEGE 08334]|uniref:PIN domain-containing protein n=1 Tax=Sphaerospermopsis sp. LEGE 08334 TaxID=1828651 RepID=UPI0018822721|nr:PIN domain-containing protein [Sphaerospermopsis sp. LEGE 08334]